MSSRPHRDASNEAALTTIGVVVICDVRLHRDAVAAVLARSDEVHVEAAGTGRGARHLIDRYLPDVVLLDATIADAPAIVRGIRVPHPSRKIVAFAVSDLDNQMIELAEAGAIGFLPRSASLEQTLAAVADAARGDAVCTPRMVATLIRHVGTLASVRPPGQGEVELTRREVEVLELVGRGLSNKEIGRMLSIELATVKNHVHSILQKLNLRRRGEAIAWLQDRNGNGRPPV